MRYGVVLWLIGIALFVAASIIPKRKRKIRGAFLIAAPILFLGPWYVPRQLFGKWNSISVLNGKPIAEIQLTPSNPNWKVNLVGSAFVIRNKIQIDSISKLLMRSQVYFPNHPSTIWESKMKLITSTRDTLEIEINQTTNNGSTIETPTNEWRNDDIGSYLEKITNYKLPVYSDTAVKRF